MWPGVVAALEAHDGVGTLGEHVGDLPFSLVAPLGADDHDSWHRALSVRGRRSAELSRRCPRGPACAIPRMTSTTRLRALIIDAVVFDLGGVLLDWNPRYLYRKLFDDEARDGALPGRGLHARVACGQ